MDLYDLWVSLNRPGAARFRDALKKRGIPARLEDVKSFTDQQVAKQLFAEPPKYRGHVISMGLDEKWAADVVINARGDNFLLVQDVFSRYAWGVVLTGKLPEAFESILKSSGRKPRVLVTDADTAFRSRDFQAMCARNGIVHEFKVGRNDISTVDRLIYTVRRALAEESAAVGAGEGGDRKKRTLADVLSGYNASGHPALMGSAPEDVPGNDLLQLEITRNNDAHRQQNHELLRKRAEKLQRAGAFRVLITSRSNFARRVFNPRWSPEVHLVGRVVGGTVFDTKGYSFPTKEVLPIPKESLETTAAIGGSDVRSRQRREALEAYAQRVYEMLHRPMRLPALRSELARMPSFLADLDAARIPKRGSQVVNFLREFPELFEVSGNGPTTTISRKER